MDGDGMGQLPEFHDSDDEELIALGGELGKVQPSGKGEQNRMPADDED